MPEGIKSSQRASMSQFEHVRILSCANPSFVPLLVVVPEIGRFWGASLPITCRADPLAYVRVFFLSFVRDRCLATYYSLEPIRRLWLYLVIGRRKAG